MKKVLFATTALVATAGVAAAQSTIQGNQSRSATITIQGWAEMGIIGGDGITTQFWTDFDVEFRMSGETDNGLTFGAGVDLDENGAFVGTDDGGAFAFLSGNFGTLTLGDTDGALDWALTEAWVNNAGSITDDETAHAGALGAYGDGAYDGQILRYDYSIGDFGFAISTELDDTDVRDPGYAIGFRYGFGFAGGSLDLGVGYQTFTTAAGYLPGNMDGAFIGAYGPGVEIDLIGVSAAIDLDGGFAAGIQYTQADENVTGGWTHIGVGAGYTFDAFTVSANWGQYDGDNPALWDVSGWGVAAAYDLGGGASIHVGYGTSEYFGVTREETWSFGVAMQF